jgi:hypothetical protein
MLTVAELIAAMEGSGRHLTARTARNWWSIGILPRTDRTGLGRGSGTVSFWRDHEVLLQAQIAYDLLRERASLENTAAALWLAGFPVPMKVVRRAFAQQIAGHYRRGLGRSRAGLEAGLWQHTDRIVRLDARLRTGSSADAMGTALYDLTGMLLELLCGVGEGAPASGDPRQWAVDTAAELSSQIDALARLGRFDGTDARPNVQAEVVEEVVTWISEVASLRRQRDALRRARPHDWSRARRITRVAIGLLDLADAAASPNQHADNRALLTGWALTWARLLFPILLAVVRDPEHRRSTTRAMFAAAAMVRRRPAR